MKICVEITQASNPKYGEYRIFHSWSKMIKYMMKRYNHWIIYFEKYPFDNEKIASLEYMKNCDYYISLTIYDDYVE